MSVPGFEPSIFVVRPPDKFFCPICLNTLRDPGQCSSGHNFCCTCLNSLPSERKICPMCREDIDMNKICKNLIVKEIINEMLTFCPSCDSVADDKSIACSWTGELHKRDWHYYNECVHRLIVCPNNCGEFVKKLVVDAHVTSVCKVTKKMNKRKRKQNNGGFNSMPANDVNNDGGDLTATEINHNIEEADSSNSNTATAAEIIDATPTAIDTASMSRRICSIIAHDLKMVGLSVIQALQIIIRLFLRYGKLFEKKIITVCSYILGSVNQCLMLFQPNRALRRQIGSNNRDQSLKLMLLTGGVVLVCISTFFYSSGNSGIGSTEPNTVSTLVYENTPDIDNRYHRSSRNWIQLSNGEGMGFFTNNPDSENHSFDEIVWTEEHNSTFLAFHRLDLMLVEKKSFIDYVTPNVILYWFTNYYQYESMSMILKNIESAPHATNYESYTHFAVEFVWSDILAGKKTLLTYVNYVNRGTISYTINVQKEDNKFMLVIDDLSGKTFDYFYTVYSPRQNVSSLASIKQGKTLLYSKRILEKYVLDDVLRIFVTVFYT